MADPKNNGHLTNVIFYAGPQSDEPRYELTGQEIVFPLNVEQQGSEFRAFFRMSPADVSYEIKEFLDDLITRRRASDTGIESEVQVADDARCRAFVDKHFLGFYGTEGEPSTEAERKLLDANPHLKMRVFREGYDAIHRKAEDEAVPATKRLRIGPAAAPEVSILGRLLLYCPKRESEVSIDIGHHLRRETEADRRKHSKAFSLIERRDITLVRCNWDVLEAMYNEMVLRLDGYVVGGAPCVSANKEEWVRLVPFTHKIYALNKTFSGTRLGN